MWYWISPLSSYFQVTARGLLQLCIPLLLPKQNVAKIFFKLRGTWVVNPMHNDLWISFLYKVRFGQSQNIWKLSTSIEHIDLFCMKVKGNFRNFKELWAGKAVDTNSKSSVDQNASFWFGISHFLSLQRTQWWGYIICGPWTDTLIMSALSCRATVLTLNGQLFSSLTEHSECFTSHFHPFTQTFILHLHAALFPKHQFGGSISWPKTRFILEEMGIEPEDDSLSLLSHSHPSYKKIYTVIITIKQLYAFNLSVGYVMLMLYHTLYTLMWEHIIYHSGIATSAWKSQVTQKWENWHGCFAVHMFDNSRYHIQWRLVIVINSLYGSKSLGQNWSNTN